MPADVAPPTDQALPTGSALLTDHALPTGSALLADPAPPADPALPIDHRIGVRKTYKLFIGGAFVRSESGRSYPVSSAAGQLLAHAARASRKDVRDAVRAARGVLPAWSAATAYNRGQVLYRIAEMLEGRRPQFVAEVGAAEGLPPEPAAAMVDAAVDRWVWYAGWADKIAQVYGNANAVAGPYFNLTTPEPTGVVGVLAPQESSLLGLVSVVAPVVATGNVCVVLTSDTRPLPAVTLAEVLATGDLPGGVVNLLTGQVAETAPWLAAHLDVNAVDLTGALDDALATELEVAAAENVKRIFRPGPAESPSQRGGPDWSAEPGLGRLLTFLEAKTVWHPKGQ